LKVVPTSTAQDAVADTKRGCYYVSGNDPARMVIVTISASGTIEPVEVVDVGAQVAGLIKAFGTDVEAGRSTTAPWSRRAPCWQKLMTRFMPPTSL